MKRFLLVLTPLLIIAGTAVVLKRFSAPAAQSGLKDGRVYAIWVLEAQAAPRHVNGVPWDVDSSAPDLLAMISWRNQLVLQTVTAPDTLIARWEPTAVGIKQLMDGEISGSSVRRVALVRASSSESICVGVFDEDLIGREFIGGIRVPLSELALGTNELIGEGMLNHCSLAITEATDELALPSNFRVTIPSAKSVEWLEAPPSEMEDPTARLAGETGSFFNDLAKEIGKKLEQEIRQSSDAAASAIKDLKHTANKAESTGKPALPIEDSK